jgi:hypothetical protein
MPEAPTEITYSPLNTGRRYVMAALLLEKWMLEESGYDDRVWPIVEKELQDAVLRCRDVDEPRA